MIDVNRRKKNPYITPFSRLRLQWNYSTNGNSKKEESYLLYSFWSSLHSSKEKRGEGEGRGILRQMGQRQGTSSVFIFQILMASHDASGLEWWKSLIAVCALANSLTGIHSFSSHGNPFQWIRWWMVFPTCLESMIYSTSASLTPDTISGRGGGACFWDGKLP